MEAMDDQRVQMDRPEMLVQLKANTMPQELIETALNNEYRRVSVETQ